MPRARKAHSEARRRDPRAPSGNQGGVSSARAGRSRRSPVFRLGYFRFDSALGRLLLEDSVGFGEEYLARARVDLSFAPGEARGLVGLVAQSGAPLYVPDTAAEPRWIGGHDLIRSGYLVPGARRGTTHDVIALLASEPRVFGPEQRALADAIIGLLVRGSAVGSAALRRLHRLEAGLQKLALDLAAIGFRVAGHNGYPPDLQPALRTLSAREWEVLRRLRRGERVPAISRKLFISPNTTRNHLKSIFRKLGVASQQQLLERLRSEEDID
jgi:DNA-binding CsgD family transcriptional regulator